MNYRKLCGGRDADFCFSMKHFIQTFGCQMNKSDSERIAFVLEKIGFRKAQKLEEADLVIINVCSVRQSAVDRLYSLISKLKMAPPGNRQGRQENDPSGESPKATGKLKILITGCILPQDKRKLCNKVDLIFNIKELAQLPKKLIAAGLPSNLGAKPLSSLNYLEIPALYSSYPSAFIPVMTGCNNFCAYCVVPYLRGREISRSPEKIINEIKKLLKKGFKRIMLLGQNVNSYQSGKYNFPKLLKKIADLPGKFWLSFITSHPKDLSLELIKVVFSSSKICKYFHLPVQSGSNKILKLMNRGYTKEKYLKIIEKIKKEAERKKETFALSTDIIVGFPKETKADFEETVSLMKKIPLAMAYIAKYSPRPLTTAFKLKDNVSQKEKQKRQRNLLEILKETALKNNKKYLSKEIEILVCGLDRKDCLYGESSLFKNVRISARGENTGGKNLIGQFARVKITNINPWGLEACLAGRQGLLQF